MSVCTSMDSVIEVMIMYMVTISEKCEYNLGNYTM